MGKVGAVSPCVRSAETRDERREGRRERGESARGREGAGRGRERGEGLPLDDIDIITSHDDRRGWITLEMDGDFPWELFVSVKIV